MHGNHKAIVCGLLAVILAAQALGLGIAPAQIDVNHPGSEQMFIINNEHKDMSVLLYAQGGDFVELPQILHLKSTDETKQFSVEILKPDTDVPGRHDVQVIAIEVPEDQSETIVARQAVVGIVSYLIPYSGKFAEAELVTPTNEPLDFVIKIRNRGTEDIQKASALIEIFSPTNELIASLHSDTKSVEPDTLRELVARYNTPLNPGKYYAKATVNYDGQEIIIEQPFEIGSMLVEIKSIYVKEFKLGGIAKFDILIESKWNDIIPDLFADFVIKDKYGKQLTKFKTRDIDLAPGELQVLDAYWDTDEVLEGQYNAKITLHFLGNNLEKSITLSVREDAIDIDLMPTGQAITEAPGTEVSFVIILIIISIIVNIALIIWFARRKH